MLHRSMEILKWQIYVESQFLIAIFKIFQLLWVEKTINCNVFVKNKVFSLPLQSNNGLLLFNRYPKMVSGSESVTVESIHSSFVKRRGFFIARQGLRVVTYERSFSHNAGSPCSRHRIDHRVLMHFIHIACACPC